MRKLIKADMGRLLRKKGVWFAFIFMIAMLVGMIFYRMNGAPDQDFAFAIGVVDGLSFDGLIMGMVLILGVYADDFKSTAYINVVGRGINRKKFIITKFLDAMIILVGMYLCAGAIAFGLKAGLGISLSSVEAKFIFLRFLYEIISTTSSIVIASLAFFIAENNAIGVIVFICFEIIIPTTIEFIVTNPIVAKYGLNRLFITGATESMLTDFIIGQNGSGFLKLFLILTFYVAAAIIASCIVFGKKELDF